MIFTILKSGRVGRKHQAAQALVTSFVPGCRNVVDLLLIMRNGWVWDGKSLISVIPVHCAGSPIVVAD